MPKMLIIIIWLLAILYFITVSVFFYVEVTNAQEEVVVMTEEQYDFIFDILEEKDAGRKIKEDEVVPEIEGSHAALQLLIKGYNDEYQQDKRPYNVKEKSLTKQLDDKLKAKKPLGGIAMAQPVQPAPQPIETPDPDKGWLTKLYNYILSLIY